MRGYILLCFLILAYGQPQDDFQTAMISKHECKVIEKKSGVSKLCAGAFIFENQTYYGCTTVRSENGKAWCSTNVDPRTNEHIIDGNFFGECTDKNCISAELGKKEQDNLLALQQGELKNS